MTMRSTVRTRQLPKGLWLWILVGVFVPLAALGTMYVRRFEPTTSVACATGRTAVHRLLFTMLLTLLAALVSPGGSGPPIIYAATSQDEADRGWAIVREWFPSDVPIYRPTSLPARFQARVWPPAPGPHFGVTYESAQGDQIVFTFGPVNSAMGSEIASIDVHGITTSIVVSDGSPPMQVRWEEHGLLYSVRAEHGRSRSTLTVDELRRIVGSLAPVGPNGKVLPTALPTTGEGGMRRPDALAVGFLAGVLLVLLGSIARRSRRASFP